MTQDLGGAVLTLSTDISKLSSGIDQAKGQIQGLGGTLDDIESKLTFTQLAVSFDAVVQGIERMVGSISSAYGHLTEFTQGLAYVRGENMSIKLIFGEAAEAIFKFGETASTSVGLSAKAFNELVAPLGALLTNVAGLTKTDAAGWAIELAKRASDLAFVFNVDVNQAMTAVGAAVRGEVEPIRALGVSFNAVMVEAKAMAMTGKENAESLTEQDKAMARLMLVMDQTSELSGVFADNTDLLFQKQQKLTAEIQNLSGELGAKLIPLNIKMIDLFTKLPEGVQLAAYALQTFGGDVINLVAGLGQATIGIAGLITAIPAIARAIQAAAIAMGTFNLALTAVVVAIAAAVVAYRLLSGSSDDAATATKRQADAQAILETMTVEGILTRRASIAALLLEAKAADTAAGGLTKLQLTSKEAREAADAHKLVIADLEGKLYTFDLALGMVNASEEKQKLATDGVTSAAEKMAGIIDTGAKPAMTSFDHALVAVNLSLDGMTKKAGDAFGALDKFKSMPTQETIALDVAIAGVNLRLADAKVRLDESIAANDGNKAAIELEIEAMEGEKEVLTHVEERLYANRDATNADEKAKLALSTAIGGTILSEADLALKSDDATRALGGQMSAADEAAQKLLWVEEAGYRAAAGLAASIGDAYALEAALYGAAVAAETAAANLGRLQQLAANPIQVPVISPGPYSAPFNASGTSNWGGGVTWVGEKGPELVNLPKGSQVFSHAQSMSLVGRAGHLASGTMGGGGGGGFGWVPQLTNDLKDAGAEATKAAATLQKLREMWAAYVRDVGVNAASYDDYMNNMLESTNQLASGMHGLIAEDFSLVKEGFYDLTDTVAVAGQAMGGVAKGLMDAFDISWRALIAGTQHMSDEMRAMLFKTRDDTAAALTEMGYLFDNHAAKWIKTSVDLSTITIDNIASAVSSISEFIAVAGAVWGDVVTISGNTATAIVDGVSATFTEMGAAMVGGFQAGSKALTPFLDSIAEAVALWGEGIVAEMTDTFKEALAISAAIAAEGAKGAAGVAVLGATSATATATRYSGSATAPSAGPAYAAPGPGGSVTQAQMDYIDQMNAMQSYAHGTPFVPRNMVAMLHKGERVVTASENRPIGGESGGPFKQDVYGPQQIVLPNVRSHDDFMRSLDRLAY